MKFPDGYLAHVYAQMPRRLRWTPDRQKDPVTWTREVRERLAALLHVESEDPTVPTADVLNREPCDGFTREKIILHLDPPSSDVPVYILIPDKPVRPVTGILCLHGHGGYYAGKSMVAGTTDTHPIAIECAEALNYGYGVQLAQAGYVTICPDAFHFGERLPESERWPQDEICAGYHTILTVFGLTAMGLSVIGNRAAISYLLARPEIETRSVGCVGLSFGGVQTLMTTLLDLRIKASVISGALFSIQGAIKREGAMCGAQAIPGMLDWFDFPDLTAALAPRPTLYEIMRKDGCFDFEEASQLYSNLANWYRSVGRPDDIQIDVADTDHRYSGRFVPEFFERHVRQATTEKG